MTTRNIVPRADGEGSIGTASKKWSVVRADTIYTDIILGSDGGGQTTSVKTLDKDDGPYTVLTTDHVLLCNTTDETFNLFTITLPTAVGAEGREYIIKKIDATIAIILVQTYGSETIDGVTGDYVYKQWSSKRYISDGTNWMSIGQDLEPRLKGKLMTVLTGYTRSVYTTEYLDIITVASEFTVDGTLVVHGTFYFETIGAKTLVRRLI